MRGPVSFAVALLLHAVTALAVWPLLEMRRAVGHVRVEAQISLATLDVPQSTARAAIPKGAAAAPAAPEVAPTAFGSLAAETARRHATAGQELVPVTDAGATLATAAPAAEAAIGRVPEGVALSAGVADSQVANENTLPVPTAVLDLPFVGETSLAAEFSGVAVAGLSPDTTSVALLVGEAAAVAPSPAGGETLEAAEAAAPLAPAASVEEAPLLTVAASSPPAPAAVPRAQPVAAMTPSTDEAPALLAWTGDLQSAVAPATLAAAAAFRLPDAERGADGLRTRLSRQLAAIPCARVQTAFSPESGALEVRGHVPSEADGARLVEAVRAELNGAVPVVNRLRRLGSPQCDVLARIAAAGIPQSVEQYTNPLIIGAELHARVYEFEGGGRMGFELGGADYDGFLTLDYFDGTGQVLHLAPNEIVPDSHLAANARVTFGDGGLRDMAGGLLALEVSAPFGQDIAVAIVTSAPLFAEPRAIAEPAEPYLAALAARFSELRAQPGFKGEWVYLFVETRRPE